MSEKIVDLILERNVSLEIVKVISEFNIKDVEYVPYLQFKISEEVKKVLGEQTVKLIRSTLKSRKTGACLLKLCEGISLSESELILFSTAISYLLGIPDIDPLSGKYYGKIIVKNVEKKDAASYLYMPYEDFSLHTDGAVSERVTDWFIFSKIKQDNATGGMTRLLHLDDWKELDQILLCELASKEFLFKFPSSNDSRQKAWGNNVSGRSLRSPIFFDYLNGVGIRFADQFVFPESFEDARFISKIASSLKAADKDVIDIELPLGSLLLANNAIWLHGRSKFERHESLSRSLIRLRGSFANF